MKRAKRKSAKKSANKKSASKKKSAKKKSAKKKATKVNRKKEMVVLDPAVPLGDDKRRLSRTDGDRILWKNLDSVEHKIRFVTNRWPFEGAQHDIVVPATGSRKSETLTVDITAAKKSYGYTIVPQIVYSIPGIPPDGPAVIVED